MGLCNQVNHSKEFLISYKAALCVLYLSPAADLSLVYAQTDVHCRPGAPANGTHLFSPSTVASCSIKEHVRKPVPWYNVGS